MPVKIHRDVTAQVKVKVVAESSDRNRRRWPIAGAAATILSGAFPLSAAFLL